MGQLESINPFAKVSKVLQGAAPSPTPSPAPATRTASGDIELPAERKVSTQVSWVGANGKRMSGTAAERDKDLASRKKPTNGRSLSKR